MKDPELIQVVCPACRCAVFIIPTASAWCKCGSKMVPLAQATRREKANIRVPAHRTKKRG